MTIIQDAVSQNYQNYGGSLTVSHTVAGTERYLLAFVGSGSVTSGVTYAGAAMTKLAEIASGGGKKLTIWGLIAPATGTNNIVCTLGGSGANAVCVGLSLTGVKQTAPHSGGAAWREEYQGSPVTSSTFTIPAGGAAFGAAFNAGPAMSTTSPATQVLMGNLDGAAQMPVSRTDSGTTIGWTWTGGAQWDTAHGSVALESAAGDVTAPSLTSPTGVQTGSTTATIGATTDESNGTMYGVVTTSGTAPNATQIQAGQDNSGVAAAYASSQSITTVGAKTFSATGLSASTTYYAHIQHKDASDNQSTVVSSASFTTTAGPGFNGDAALLSFGASGTIVSEAPAGVITTPPLNNNTGHGLRASESGVTVFVKTIADDTPVVTLTGLTTDTDGTMTFSDSAIAAGTEYCIRGRFSDGHEFMGHATAT